MTRTGLSNSCITLSGMNDAAGALSGNIPIFSDSGPSAVSGRHSWPGLPRFLSFLLLWPCASILLLQSFAHIPGLTGWETGQLGCTRLVGWVNGDWSLKWLTLLGAALSPLHSPQARGMCFPEGNRAGLWTRNALPASQHEPGVF